MVTLTLAFYDYKITKKYSKVILLKNEDRKTLECINKAEKNVEEKICSKLIHHNFFDFKIAKTKFSILL